MRSFLIAVLLFVFAGVHTVAAMGNGYPDPAVGAQSVHAPNALEAEEIAANSHHMQCCAKADSSEAAGKIANCSADCASFKAENFVHRMVLVRILESVPLPELSEFSPDPEDHPPRFG